MSLKDRLQQELQELIERLFKLPPAWGDVSSREDGPIIHRIGTIKRLLTK
jgi:hypothetical protein